MEYKVYYYSNKNEIKNYVVNKDEKKAISNIYTFNWSDDIAFKHTSFDFETNEDLNCGAWIELYDSTKKETVFFGIIKDKSISEENKFKYSGRDYGFILEKKPVDIQFNGNLFQDAIQDVCSKNNIDVGSIEPTETVYIKKNYRNINKVADIVDDIHIKTLNGKIENNYYFTCKDGKVNLKKCPFVERIDGYIARRMQINSFDYILKCNKTLKAKENSNKKSNDTIDNNENDTKSKDIKTNNSKINKIKEHFDKINKEAEKRKKEEIEERRIYAESLEEISLTVYADFQLQSGIKTNIYNSKLGIDGLYIIASSKHRISGNSEEVDITARRLGARIDSKKEEDTQKTFEQIKTKENTIIDVLKTELLKRNNPTDLKSGILGKIEQINPIIISISDGNIQLKENDHLEISEWFRFRCNIDKESALSSDVPDALKSAKDVKETHSYTPKDACSMPSAIGYLATAISKINTELLALKCNLAIGDYVTVASLEETDKYVLLDKVL